MFSIFDFFGFDIVSRRFMNAKEDATLRAEGIRQEAAKRNMTIIEYMDYRAEQEKVAAMKQEQDEEADMRRREAEWAAQRKKDWAKIKSWFRR